MRRTIAGLTLGCVASLANAGVIIGGSTLLTDAYETQLENWLGQGQLTLTNIFTKAAGNTSHDFHLATDGKGATFTVMYATEQNTGRSAIIGGYNPMSWTNSNGYHLTYSPSDATGFIFNLSTGVKDNQNLTSGRGVYQSYNWDGYGPTFGGGHDIYVASDLNSGYSYLWSYAPGQTGVSLVDGSSYNGADMRIRALEVFTISSYSVPEPGSLALSGLALAGLASLRSRNRVR